MKIVKPPIGIEPEWVWERLRMINLAEAIKRYINAGMPVSIKWIKEYNKLAKKDRTNLNI